MLRRVTRDTVCPGATRVQLVPAFPGPSPQGVQSINLSYSCILYSVSILLLQPSLRSQQRNHLPFVILISNGGHTRFLTLFNCCFLTRINNLKIVGLKTALLKYIHYFRNFLLPCIHCLGFSDRY